MNEENLCNACEGKPCCYCDKVKLLRALEEREAEHKEEKHGKQS